MSKIKAKFINYDNNTLDNDNNNLKVKDNVFAKFAIGETNTTAATTAKVSTISNYTLTTGDMIAMKFVLGNTVASMTLNINSTGAKNILLNGIATNTTTATLAANTTLLLFYDGTSFHMTGSQRTTDSNTTYSEITEAEIDAGTSSSVRSISGRRVGYIFTKTGNMIGVNTNKITVSATEPSGAVEGDLWVDTSV
jgi:hypothetical protein